MSLPPELEAQLNQERQNIEARENRPSRLQQAKNILNRIKNAISRPQGKPSAQFSRGVRRLILPNKIQRGRVRSSYPTRKIRPVPNQRQNYQNFLQQMQMIRQMQPRRQESYPKQMRYIPQRQSIWNRNNVVLDYDVDMLGNKKLVQRGSVSAMWN